MTELNALNDFVESARKYPENIAIIDGKIEYTYEELLLTVQKLSYEFKSKGIVEGDCIGILCKRSIESIISMLAALYSGASYVSLNPKFPIERIEYILSASNSKFLLTDKVGYAVASENSIFTNEIIQFERLENKIEFAQSPDFKPFELPLYQSQTCAYMIFTSGTTGTPKGIQVSHYNLVTFIQNLKDEYRFNEKDRFSQFFEHTFDAAVNDIYLSLSSGSTLIIMNDAARFSPAKFLMKNKITVMATVPSTINFMKRVKQLKENFLPDLRLTFFGGEALHGHQVEDWQKVAPQTKIENHYGPSECTVLVSFYSCRVDDYKKDFIPIGKVLKNHDFLILDESDNQCASGSKGELLISGPQVSLGYLNNELNKKSFPVINEKRWYRTGDIVYLDKDENLVFVSRLDGQIQLFGNRVEVEDVNAKLKASAKAIESAIIPWPIIDGDVQGLIGFYAQSELEVSAVVDSLKAKLPQYMLPSKVIKLDQMPLTLNGKIDKKELIKLLAD